MNRLVALGALLAALGGGGGYWTHSKQFEDTDDAQVDGNICNVSPRVAGNIKAVYVVDNQRVSAGDVIAEIDTTDLEIAVAQAKAAVAQAEAQLRAEDPSIAMTETENDAEIASTSSDVSSARASIGEAQQVVDQLTAQIAEARARDRTAQTDRERAERLMASATISQADLDNHVNAAEASTANVRALEHALGAARDRVTERKARFSLARARIDEAQTNAPRRVEARKASVTARRASLDLAKAQLARAELDLGHAKIVAPASGIVGKKSVNVGDHVAPGQQILAIAQVDALWVTANFRETQLTHVRVGQSAEVEVDAIGVTLHGTVESVGGATGSKFSLLPPENASGNYVKVVQRVPVRIALDTNQPGLERLRLGMSVEPTVRVR